MTYKPESLYYILFIYELCWNLHFGMGKGKILVIIFFMIIGLLIALNRKIIPLSVVFFLTYVGSLFSKGQWQDIYNSFVFYNWVIFIFFFN